MVFILLHMLWDTVLQYCGNNIESYKSLEWLYLKLESNVNSFLFLWTMQGLAMAVQAAAASIPAMSAVKGTVALVGTLV